MFPMQGAGKRCIPAALSDVGLVQKCDLKQMLLQRLFQALGKNCRSILSSLSIANAEDACLQIDVLDP